MTVVIALATLLIGAVIGALLTARFQRQAAETELANLRSDAATARADAARVREQQSRELLGVADAQRDIAEARHEAAAARALHAEISAKVAAAQAERNAAIERAKELAADRESMLNQFKVLSSETLDQHGKAADTVAEQRLKATEQLLTPVKESLRTMQERINEVEKTREAMSAELREQVRSLALSNESLRKETHSLSTALRTPQVRGAWGEQSLKRIVEMSGMVERCDFFQQASTRTDDGLFRPDLTIRLAGDKVIFVDSKVPLTALLDAYNTEDEAARADHLKRFGRLVRTHVDDLSKKNYWTLDAGSPEFVVLFLASEEIFHVALQQQPDLQEYAGTKQIVLASPGILIGLLKTIAHGWQQERLAESAAEVQTLGRELFERLTKLSEHFDGVGRGLTQAVKAYNGAVGSLESRVLVTARRLNELEVTRGHLKGPKAISESTREITAPELLEQLEDTAD